MLARIVKNAAAQGLGLLVTFADRFLVVGILLRAWGPQVYSEWAVLLSCVGLLSLGELGLNIYYGNVLQEAWTAQDKVRFQRMISVAMACSLGVATSLCLIALAVLAIVDVPKALAIHAMPHPHTIAVLALMGIATLSRITRGSISQVFRGHQQFAVGAMVDLAFPISSLASMITAGLLGASPPVLASLYLACDLVFGWGFMLWSLRTRWPQLRFVPALPTGAELVDIAHHVKWLAVLQGGPVAWLQIPVLVLAHFGVAGASLVSFVILRTLVNFTRSISTMISLGSGVEIAALHHAGRTADVVRSIHAVGLALSVVSTSVAVGLVLFGPALVTIWTGQPGMFDYRITVALLLSAVLVAPSSALASHLMYANTPRPLALAMLGQIAIGLGACLLLIPMGAAAGAAAGLAIGETFGLGVLLPVLAARLIPNLGYPRHLIACILAMTATGLWCGGVGWVVTASIGGNGWAGLIASGAVWAVIGLLPSMLLALPKAQRAAIADRVGLRWAKIA